MPNWEEAMTTTTRQDIDLMAHLMRRAAFGAPLDELERRASMGYEETVEELLNPGDPRDLSQDTIRRYHVDQSELRQMNSAAGNWLYRMITSKNPLEERVALFFHSLFATGYAKLNQARSLLNQIDMFRIHGLGRFDTILIELSKDPAMLLWLDNNENHNGHINENYGRELLELFSMGIGNYTEDDIKEASRAFTGWTLGNVEYMAMRAMKDSIWPYSRIAWHYQYRADDHDEGEKTFLGETGNFNGEDIVAIICRQRATAEFICTRLFQFFAADHVDDDGKATIEEMIASYFASGLRDQVRAPHPVQLRLLQIGRGPVRASEGAGRVRRRCDQDGGQLPPADPRHRQGGGASLLHGAGSPESPHGRGVARSRGVDR